MMRQIQKIELHPQSIEHNRNYFFNSNSNSNSMICYGSANIKSKLNYCNIVKLTEKNSSEANFENFYHLMNNTNLVIVFKDGIFKGNRETFQLEKIEFTNQDPKFYSELRFTKLLSQCTEDINWIYDEESLKIIDAVTGFSHSAAVKIENEDKAIDLIRQKSGLVEEYVEISTLTNIKNNTVEFRFHYDYKNANEIMKAMEEFLNTAAGKDLKFIREKKHIFIGNADSTLIIERNELPNLLEGLMKIEKREFNFSLLNKENKNPQMMY
ncbi:MAG: hypothetical protein HYX60_00555 [Legionella longbeachae]|nr:hypothetical protein [Legionella longbeachae]